MKAPSVSQLKRLMELVGYVIFPDYSDVPSWTNGNEAIHAVLADQLSTITTITEPDKMADDFVQALPEIARLLHTDALAVMHNDPAVKSMQEVILCYPVVKVMVHYRTAHQLHLQGVPIIPRVITEMAHSATGIDIHPAAQIGEHFCIDHGTGVVIGATCIIGNNVKLYQGVTLGALSTRKGQMLSNVKRHPTIGNNVTVYSNASILGGETVVGNNSTIGGGAFITSSVPENTRVHVGPTDSGNSQYENS